MRMPKNPTKHAVLTAALAVVSPAIAQHNHGGMQSPEPSSSTFERRDSRPMEQARSFEGEIRGIDKFAGTVTLKHEPMSSLDRPATTAAYPVKDASMLEHVEVGDQVRFTAVLQGRVLLITKITPAN